MTVSSVAHDRLCSFVEINIKYVYYELVKKLTLHEIIEILTSHHAYVHTQKCEISHKLCHPTNTPEFMWKII